MENLTSEQVEIIKDQIGESVSYGSMYPNVARTLVEILEAAINYTHCCKSDSEQLPSFLYKSDGGLYFKHREDADVIEQWNEYLKTR